MEFPNLLSLNAYEIWAAIGKTVAGKGLPRKRDDRQLARLARKNRFCSSKRLAGMWKETGVEASDRTAHGRLHEQGFRCHIPAVKPLLNGRQRQKRLKWCREKKEERRQSNGLQSCFPTSPSLLFLLETKVPECGGKRVKGT